MSALVKHKLPDSVGSGAVWEAKPDVADFCEEDNVCSVKVSPNRLLLGQEIWGPSRQCAYAWQKEDFMGTSPLVLHGPRLVSLRLQRVHCPAVLEFPLLLSRLWPHVNLQ